MAGGQTFPDATRGQSTSSICTRSPCTFVRLYPRSYLSSSTKQPECNTPPLSTTYRLLPNTRSPQTWYWHCKGSKSTCLTPPPPSKPLQLQNGTLPHLPSEVLVSGELTLSLVSPRTWPRMQVSCRDTQVHGHCQRGVRRDIPTMVTSCLCVLPPPSQKQPTGLLPRYLAIRTGAETLTQ